MLRSCALSHKEPSILRKSKIVIKTGLEHIPVLLRRTMTCSPAQYKTWLKRSYPNSSSLRLRRRRKFLVVAAECVVLIWTQRSLKQQLLCGRSQRAGPVYLCDKCDPGDVCKRCENRSQSSRPAYSLGCIRIKLVELMPCFVPRLVTQIYEGSHLKHFVNQNVQEWGDVEYTLYMTCGKNSMPRIPVKVHKFVPKGNKLPVHTGTNKKVTATKHSLALGIKQPNYEDMEAYDNYVSNIVDNHLANFGKICWMDDDNNFLQEIFKLMIQVKFESRDEVSPSTLPSFAKY
jgi:hypothetical protein